MIVSGIYLIENKTQNKFYVGSSADIDRRLYDHFAALKSNRHTVKEMQEDYNKGDTFTSRTLKVLDSRVKNYLLDEEDKYIKEYSKKGTMYNKVYSECSHFVSKKQLENLMLDLFCKERFGKTYSQLTSRIRSGKIELLYRILLEPEKEQELKEEYQSLLDLQNKEYYKTHTKK